jgi:hypothetical protein
MKHFAIALLAFTFTNVVAQAGEFDSHFFDSPEEKYEASKTEEYKDFEDSIATAYCENLHTVYYMEHYEILQYKADDFAKTSLKELNSLSATNNSSLPTHPFLKKYYSGAIVNKLIDAKKLASESYDYVKGLSLYVGHVSKVKSNYVSKIQQDLKEVINFYELEEINAKINSCEKGNFDD